MSLIVIFASIIDFGKRILSSLGGDFEQLKRLKIMNHKGFRTVDKQNLIDMFIYGEFYIDGVRYYIQSIMTKLSKRKGYVDYYILCNRTIVFSMNWLSISRDHDEDVIRFIEKSYIELLYRKGILKSGVTK